ncbi:ABC transporter ATP-binding protein [Reyranella sp. CPCC 100927]|nr:ABC transporter ATP-binding protein [Reyranella sp. CPCC 100927]
MTVPSPSPAPSIVSVTSVSMHFGGFRALDDVSIDLQRGEIHAIIGPNGAGKSTLLNVISGLLRPTRGDVHYGDQRITHVPPHRRARMGIARSFQITSIFTGFTVHQNVQLALLAQRGDCRHPFRLTGERYRDEAHELLARVQIAGMGARMGGELAAGDRKRLEFAIALAGNPQVLLLDEPTAGMSSAEREIVVGIIRSLSAERQISVLFTEHDIDMVFDNAHRITVMHQGRRLVQGTPAAVRSDPRVRDVYLGEGDDAHV